MLTFDGSLKVYVALEPCYMLQEHSKRWPPWFAIV